jgi:hypothetical protein
MLGHTIGVRARPRPWSFWCRHESRLSKTILPSLTLCFARSSGSASESTLIAACGWSDLTALIACPLSGMATSNHSCSGAPLSLLGKTVTIFHPFAICSISHGSVQRRTANLGANCPDFGAAQTILGQAVRLLLRDGGRCGCKGALARWQVSRGPWPVWSDRGHGPRSHGGSPSQTGRKGAGRPLALQRGLVTPLATAGACRGGPIAAEVRGMSGLQEIRILKRCLTH